MQLAISLDIGSMIAGAFFSWLFYALGWYAHKGLYGGEKR